PHPCFRIDRFPNAPEHSQRREVVFCNPFFAVLHKCPYSSWCGVKDIHAVLVANIPESSWIGVCRNAFEHKARCSVAQRPVDNITMPGNPADISGAEMDVFLMVIEYPLEGKVCIQHIAACSME